MFSRIPHFFGMKQKTRDNLIYVGIALAVVAAFTGHGKNDRDGTEYIRPNSLGHSLHTTIIALILERFWDGNRGAETRNMIQVAMRMHCKFESPKLWSDPLN